MKLNYKIISMILILLLINIYAGSGQNETVTVTETTTVTVTTTETIDGNVTVTVNETVTEIETTTITENETDSLSFTPSIDVRDDVYEKGEGIQIDYLTVVEGNFSFIHLNMRIIITHEDGTIVYDDFKQTHNYKERDPRSETLILDSVFKIKYPPGNYTVDLLYNGVEVDNDTFTVNDGDTASDFYVITTLMYILIGIASIFIIFVIYCICVVIYDTFLEGRD